LIGSAIESTALLFMLCSKRIGLAFIELNRRGLHIRVRGKRYAGTSAPEPDDEQSAARPSTFAARTGKQRQNFESASDSVH
jgi:hypothetical protein